MGRVLLRSVVRCGLSVRPEKDHERFREFASLTRKREFSPRSRLLSLSRVINDVLVLTRP